MGQGTPVSAPLSSAARPPPAAAGPWGRPSRACAPGLLRAGERARSPGAGTRGGAKPGPLPPRAPMYAFYSLLIYIFYSLFRRDGGAKATADPRDPNQVSGGGLCRPAQRKSPGLALRRGLCRGSPCLLWCCHQRPQPQREAAGLSSGASRAPFLECQLQTRGQPPP